MVSSYEYKLFSVGSAEVDHLFTPPSSFIRPTPPCSNGANLITHKQQFKFNCFTMYVNMRLKYFSKTVFSDVRIKRTPYSGWQEHTLKVYATM